MRRAIIASIAILSAMGTAGAVDDWDGVVKVQSAYGNQTGTNTPQINIAVDVVYDKTGQRGNAWGTLSYGTSQNGFAPDLAGLRPRALRRQVQCGKPSCRDRQGSEEPRRSICGVSFFRV